MTRFRVVSCWIEQGELIRWKVQRRAGRESESTWEDCTVFPYADVNLFREPTDALRVARDMDKAGA